MVDLTWASVRPQCCSSQRKRVCPAVWANGRCNTGSRGPGAWPTRITSLTIGPPETGVDFIRGQRRHLRRAMTCRRKLVCGEEAMARERKRSTLNAQRPMSEGKKAADDHKIDSRVGPNMMGIRLEPDIRTARIRDRPTVATALFLEER